MKWFKHYSNSLHSDSLSVLLTECGLEGYARYWLLLEDLADRFNGSSTSFRIPASDIRTLFRIRSWNEIDSFAIRLSNVRGLKVKRNGNICEIEAPILLELLGRDFRSARQAREEAAPKKKNKDIDIELINTSTNVEVQKSESTSAAEATIFPIIPELAHETINDVLRGINPQMQKRWIKIFKDPEWIKIAIEEAISFYTASGTANASNWAILLHRALYRAKERGLNAKKGQKEIDWKAFFESEGAKT